MSTPSLIAIQSETEAIVAAVLRGDRGAAADIATSMANPTAGVLVLADVVSWALKAACDFGYAAGGIDTTPADLWAAWLLHKAAGFPDPTREDNPR